MVDPTSDGPSSLDHERLQRAVHESPAAEVAVASGTRPRTFPLTPFYDAEKESVVVTSPPAFAGKIEAVRENPKLAVLFYAADEPFVLCGRGRVRDDDLDANSEYVQQLIADEPPSPKKEGFTKSGSVLDSRVGRFLFGWYALRVVVEIEPVEIVAIDGDGDSGPIPAWPEHGLGTDEAASYDRLTLTVVDSEGWPTPRAVRGVDVDGERARLDVPLSADDGQPACLLGHWHTPGLDKLGQRLFRGRVRSADTTDGRIGFEPGSTFSMRNQTLLDRLKFIVQGKRRTRAYFADREG
ncbi:MAG: hypothetical protein ACI8U4_000208 [Natronomonas sp.]|jgi:hypothetical protein